MAQKNQTLFIDDLDGSAAEGTVRFGLDGTEYEIDLNARNAKKVRDALAPYVSWPPGRSARARKPAAAAAAGRRTVWTPPRSASGLGHRVLR